MTQIPPLLLVGAGKMGAAMFGGWCRAGLAPSALVDPSVSGVGRPEDIAVGSLAELPPGFAPAVAVIAVKPQMASGILSALDGILPPGCIVLSIMAGITIGALETASHGRPVVRAMPNTPASIGRGVTVACGGEGLAEDVRALCERLLAAVGDVAWVDREALLDPVTGVSGSGPAYVFLLAEILEQVAAEEGIPPDLARLLARRTVSGAGALLDASEADTAALRQAVTSPGGTTEKALAVLMEPQAWPATIRRAVAANMARARALAG